MANAEILDALVIGGGISGVIFLKTAAGRNLRVRLVERQQGVGGKWRELPAWQDIQMRPEDWSLNGIAMGGVTQPYIVENAENWVKRYQLEKFLSLGTAVEKVRWTDDHWLVSTDGGDFRARNLVVATGALNAPNIPAIAKTAAKVLEFHSSQLHDPSLLKGQRVVVVGGSHSAWDLLELALKHEAREIHWVYRNARWMIPSRRPKHERTDVRSLALGLFSSPSLEKLSAKYETYLERAYRHFGIGDLKPEGPFRLERHLLVGGRPGMLRELSKIHRYRGTVAAIQGNTVTVGDQKLTADIVLYATGYRMHMPFLQISSQETVQAQEALARRCNVRCQSREHPNLFFVGPTVVESNIVSPLYAAILSKTIVSAIQRKTAFPDKVIENPIVHWNLLKELAAFDRDNYSRFWKLKYRALAWFYWKFPGRQLRI